MSVEQWNIQKTEPQHTDPPPPTPAWRSSSSSSRLGEGGSRSSDVNKRTSDINAVSFFCLEMDDGGETSVVLWPHGGAGGRSQREELLGGARGQTDQREEVL